MASASTDLYSFPVIIYPRTYFIVAGVALIFVWIGLQLANRKVRQLDMVEALKIRIKKEGTDEKQKAWIIGGLSLLLL